MVVSGTEARLDHGKSNILGRKTAEHAAMALSSQRRAEGWEVGGEGLIRTLRPRPSQRGRKRDFFFSSSFFFSPANPKDLFDSPENYGQGNNFLLLFFLFQAFTSLNVPGTASQQASRVPCNTFISMFLKKQ